MKKRKVIALLTALLTTAVLLTGCGGGEEQAESSGDKYKFVIGHSMADDTSFGYAVNQNLAEALEESGYFDVEVYGASALGNESECIQATQAGDMQSVYDNSSYIFGLYPGCVCVRLSDAMDRKR